MSAVAVQRDLILADLSALFRLGVTAREQLLSLLHSEMLCACVALRPCLDGQQVLDLTNFKEHVPPCRGGTL